MDLESAKKIIQGIKDSDDKDEKIKQIVAFLESVIENDIKIKETLAQISENLQLAGTATKTIISSNYKLLERIDEGEKFIQLSIENSTTNTESINKIYEHIISINESLTKIYGLI